MIPADLMDEIYELLEPPAWHKDAACKEHPDVNFFPERGDTRGLLAARKICATCLVTQECFDAGLKEREGIWGGMSARTRKRSRSPMPIATCGTRSGAYRHRALSETVCENCKTAELVYDREQKARRKAYLAAQKPKERNKTA